MERRRNKTDATSPENTNGETVNPTRIQAEVRLREKGGRALWNNPPNLDSSILAILKQVVELQETGWKPPEALPDYPTSPLPKPLEIQRDATTPIDLPPKYHSWLHFVSASATDNEWRAWLLDQQSPKPVGGLDPEIALIQRKTIETGQKLTHMGAPLSFHLLRSSVELRTDEIGNSNIATPLRFGMLVHDIGKLRNVHTPGSHQGVGTKIFRDWVNQYNLFKWLSGNDHKLVEWTIANHDLFGRLARGLSEKESTSWNDDNFDPLSPPKYSGALGLLDVLERITELEALDISRTEAIHIARLVWEADAGSVAALRWVLPQAEHIESALLRL